MRLPRDLSGVQLAWALARLGYQVSRQTGSHMRLTRTAAGGQHHITIPSHDPLKVGTLRACERIRFQAPDVGSCWTARVERL